LQRCPNTAYNSALAARFFASNLQAWGISPWQSRSSVPSGWVGKHQTQALDRRRMLLDSLKGKAAFSSVEDGTSPRLGSWRRSRNPGEATLLRHGQSGCLAVCVYRALLIRRGRTSSRYCSFTYSALGSVRMGMSGSASFQRLRKSL